MLSNDYYNQLLKKYNLENSENKILKLNQNLIFSNYEQQNTHFNIPNNEKLFTQIVNQLYNELAIYIFKNRADLPPLKVGDKVKKKGGNSKDIYKILSIINDTYTLINKNSKLPNVPYERLVKNYTPITQNIQDRTLTRYENHFEAQNTYGFLPTNFTRKIVFIASKSIWDSLKDKDKIPSIYLPNTRDNTDQSIIKSIPALSDCITYVTPKYEICYEQILKKKVEVDTLIVCDTDINVIQQILSDQSKYSFMLIILSNEYKPLQTSASCWHWHKEEVDLIEGKNTTDKITIQNIQDDDLEKHVQKFEECMNFVNDLDYSIKINSYSYFLRLGLNSIQSEVYDYLLNRLENNRELENNQGGYSMDFIGNNNPKEALKKLLLHLRNNSFKLKKLSEFVKIRDKTILIADNNDKDFLLADKQIKQNRELQIKTYKELKKEIKTNSLEGKTLIFYTFNGNKDFDFIYHLKNTTVLILHEQEANLYEKALQNYKHSLEKEITSDHRFNLCGIKYEPPKEKPIYVNPTLESIIDHLDELSNTAYEGYKEENESILEELEEQLLYKITFDDNSNFKFDSNETVFNTKGDLFRVYQLKEQDKIRIYPKEHLAENLFKIAVETEPEIFGKVEEHAQIWLRKLKELDKIYISRSILYDKLQKKGLKVLPATVDAYFHGNRKFPMYNSDVKAIIELSEDQNLIDLLPQMLKSKRLYSSTMIALGRGIKQELKQYFKEKTIGEILQKRKFTTETLEKFTIEKMPVLSITKIEISKDEQP